MPKWSGVTFSVQPVEYRGKVSGYVVAGFLNEAQLVALRELVDSTEYKRSKMWRGRYQDLAIAITSSIDKASKAAKAAAAKAPAKKATKTSAAKPAKT